MLRSRKDRVGTHHWIIFIHLKLLNWLTFFFYYYLILTWDFYYLIPALIVLYSHIRFHLSTGNIALVTSTTNNMWYAGLFLYYCTIRMAGCYYTKWYDHLWFGLNIRQYLFLLLWSAVVSLSSQLYFTVIVIEWELAGGIHSRLKMETTSRKR